jgi:hypothetical protein
MNFASLKRQLDRQRSLVSTALEKGSVYPADLEKLAMLIRLYSEKERADKMREDPAFWAKNHIS